MRPEIGLDLFVSGMPGPTFRCRLPQEILHVESCSPFDKKPHHRIMPPARRLVKWRGMGMAADRVVTVWIFARIQQESNDLNMTEIGRQGERQVAILRASAGKQATRVLDTAKRRSDRQIYRRAEGKQCVHRLKLSV